MSEKKSGLIKNMEQEIQELKEECRANLAGWQRAQADYANLKKDNDKRGKEIMAIANASFMSEILPVYSHFKLALKHIPKDQSKSDWVTGIKHIKKQFEEFLNKYNIEEVATIGERFNPQFHEAVSHEEKDEFDSDVIFEEVQPGYLVDGKLLNPAKVKVAR